MTDARTQYSRAASVLWRTCPQTVLLLPRGAESPLSLSGSGVALWDLLEDPQTVATTSSRLAEQFKVDIDEVTPAVVKVLDELLAARAVESQAG